MILGLGLCFVENEFEISVVWAQTTNKGQFFSNFIILDKI